MGTFQEQVILVNRAPIDLNVCFDGQNKTLTPGDNIVPGVTVQYAKNQNHIMGSRNPYDPNIDGGRYLVGVKGTKDDCTPLSPEEWAHHLDQPCADNMDEMLAGQHGADPKAKYKAFGKGRKTTAASRYEAGTQPQGNSTFTNDK